MPVIALHVCNRKCCFFVFFLFVLVEGVFSESGGNFEGTESYPDESPKLQYLQVSLHTGQYYCFYQEQKSCDNDNILLINDSTLSGLVEFDGFYLESDPCLVCNNPEVPFSVSMLQFHLLGIKWSMKESSRCAEGSSLPLHWLLFAQQNIKLSSIKVDTRYTTTQQVVKLIGSHTISKVTVKIGDLKRTKMVRTINLYYNNRTVQAIVELKNK